MLADTNLLIKASKGDQAALAAIRNNDVQVTPGVYREFVAQAGYEGQRAARINFLDREGITKLSSNEAALLRETSRYRAAYDYARSYNHSPVDADMVGLGHAAGRLVLSSEKRLPNTFNMTGPKLGVRIERVP